MITKDVNKIKLYNNYKINEYLLTSLKEDAIAHFH